MTTDQPSAHEAGFFRRMPAGGTANHKPDPLLPDAVADGSHAIAVEDRVAEIRQEIEDGLAKDGISKHQLAYSHPGNVLTYAIRVFAAREADLARDRDFYQERYVRASEAMTPALGEDVTDEVGQGLVSDVTVLVQRYLAAAAREAALLSTKDQEIAGLVVELERVQGVADYAKDRIDKALELHRESKIYDECGHKHKMADDYTVPEGLHLIEDVGLTCEDGYQYSICRECCTDDGYQTETCVDNHEHGGSAACWPCPTHACLAGGER